jgi:hypothetical protein
MPGHYKPKPPIGKNYKRPVRRKTVAPRAGGMVEEYGRQIGEKAKPRKAVKKATRKPAPKIGQKRPVYGLKFKDLGR